MIAEASRLEATHLQGVIMPVPKCHKCATEIVLDPPTYRNYQGSVTCPACLDRMQVEISNGQLVKSRPVLPPEWIEGLYDSANHSIPAQPLADYLEAIVCLGNKCNKAAAVMIRRSLQGALLNRGVEEATPARMVKAAVGQGILDYQHEALAVTVSFFGGKGAHPDDAELEMVDELLATQGLLVTKKLLLALFPPPAA